MGRVRLFQVIFDVCNLLSICLQRTPKILLLLHYFEGDGTRVQKKNVVLTLNELTAELYKGTDKVGLVEGK